MIAHLDIIITGDKKKKCIFVKFKISYPLQVTVGVGTVGGPTDGHITIAGTLLTGLRPP